MLTARGERRHPPREREAGRRWGKETVGEAPHLFGMAVNARESGYEPSAQMTKLTYCDADPQMPIRVKRVCREETGSKSGHPQTSNRVTPPPIPEPSGGSRPEAPS